MLLALFVPTASASLFTGYMDCGGVGSVTGTTGFVGGSVAPPGNGNVTINASGVAQITCPAYASIPAGDYITQIDLQLQDDAHKPSASGASVIDNWNGVSGLTFATNNWLESITMLSTTAINFDKCIPTGGMVTTGGVCPVVLSFTVTGQPTTFGAIVLSVQAIAGSGGGVAAGNGGDSADLYIQYEYSPVAPEPATLGLMGGALLGLGIFGSKKLRRS